MSRLHTHHLTDSPPHWLTTSPTHPLTDSRRFEKYDLMRLHVSVSFNFLCELLFQHVRTPHNDSLGLWTAEIEMNSFELSFLNRPFDVYIFKQMFHFTTKHKCSTFIPINLSYSFRLHEVWKQKESAENQFKSNLNVFQTNVCITDEWDHLITVTSTV